MESSIHVLLMNVIIIVFPFHGYKSKAFACTAEGSFDCLHTWRHVFSTFTYFNRSFFYQFIQNLNKLVTIWSYLHQVSDFSLLHWLVIRIIDQRFNFLFSVKSFICHCVLLYIQLFLLYV